MAASVPRPDEDFTHKGWGPLTDLPPRIAEDSTRPRQCINAAQPPRVCEDRPHVHLDPAPGITPRLSIEDFPEVRLDIARTDIPSPAEDSARPRQRNNG